MRRTCIGRCKPRKRRGRGLGRVEWDAPTRTATIYVGQNRGNEQRSREGDCRRAPSAYSAKTIDKHFRKLREAQVGAGYVGATRMQNKGWYKGVGEASMAYQVIHDPYVPGESEWSDFQKRMNQVAETLAKRVCQDEVLVTFDDGNGKHTCSFSSDPDRPDDSPDPRCRTR